MEIVWHEEMPQAGRLCAPDPELMLHSGTDHTITPVLFNVVENLSSKVMLEVIVFMILFHLTEGAGIKSTKRILSQQALLKFPDLQGTLGEAIVC